MDLNEYLETIVEFNIEKPYGIIIAQVIFDSFRKYCIDYIETPKDTEIESLYTLALEYSDEPFKKYIDELFQDTHIEQFDTRELCLEFFRKFIIYLNSIIGGIIINEDIITDFLDHNIYKYFEIILSDYPEFLFFPKTYEDSLNIDVYEGLRNALIEQQAQIAGERINTPIEEIIKEPVKSVTHAVIKKKHKKTKKHLSFKAHLITRKRKHN